MFILQYVQLKKRPFLMNCNEQNIRDLSTTAHSQLLNKTILPFGDHNPCLKLQYI